jgi:hypothetical protein
MYLFFALPLTVLGLLQVAAAWRPAARRALFAAVWCASATAYLALSGTFRSLLPANQGPLVRDHGIPHCSIWLSRPDAEFYGKALEVINSEGGPDESIFVLPCNPELYYLSGRRNPTRFYLTAIGVRSRREVEALEAQFERSPPRLVFYNPHHRYKTDESNQLMDWVSRHYDALGPVGAQQVYRWRGGDGTSPAAPRERPREAGDDRERDEP